MSCDASEPIRSAKIGLKCTENRPQMYRSIDRQMRSDVPKSLIFFYKRFVSVKKRFTMELKELRGRETQSLVAQNVISLLMGMKFFRVKVNNQQN